MRKATAKKATEPKRTGRPPEKVPVAVADEVVDWISEGKTLRSFCRQDGRPARRTIDGWREKDENFRARIARARDIGFDVIAEECLEIADDATNDWMEREGKNGESYTVIDSEHIQRSRLRIETRLKLLAKWCHQRYGDGTGITSQDDIEPDARFE